MTKEAPVLELPVPSAAANYTTADVRTLFADVTKRTPRDEESEHAFLTSKWHLIRTHPTFDPATRKVIADDYTRGLNVQVAQHLTGPVPGGVGYGMFYNSSFKTNWATGTAIYW